MRCWIAFPFSYTPCTSMHAQQHIQTHTHVYGLSLSVSSSFAVVFIWASLSSQLLCWITSLLERSNRFVKNIILFFSLFAYSPLHIIVSIRNINMKKTKNIIHRSRQTFIGRENSTDLCIWCDAANQSVDSLDAEYVDIRLAIHRRHIVKRTQPDR